MLINNPLYSITGLAIASSLPKNYDITVVARNLPGDLESTEWASPWAGAVFMGMADSSEKEQKLQLESFWVWWNQALRHPESSVRQVEMQDLIDDTTLDKVWYRNKLPGFRVMSKDELPEGAPFGMSYKSIIITPPVYLVWLRKRLESSGVKFQRLTVNSLADLRGMGHDVLINATGVGARHLRDVADARMQEVRGSDHPGEVKLQQDLDPPRQGLHLRTWSPGRNNHSRWHKAVRQHDYKGRRPSSCRCNLFHILANGEA